MCNKLHELDATRFTTMGQNGLMSAGIRLRDIMQDVMEKFGPLKSEGGEGVSAMNSFIYNVNSN